MKPPFRGQAFEKFLFKTHALSARLPSASLVALRGPAVVGFTKGINGGWREAGTEHGVRTRRAECGERAGSAREAESRVVLGVRVDAETEGREGEHRPGGERDGSPGLAEARRPPGRAGQRARADSQGRPSAVPLHRTRDDKDQRRRAARSSKARRQTVFLGPDAKTFRCDVCPSTLCDAGATPTPQPRPRDLWSNRWHLPASCGRFVGTEEEGAMLHVGVLAGRMEGSASSV